MTADRINEIERAVASGEMTAAQVFTQMRQLCRATAEQAGNSEAQSYVEPDGCPTELAVLQRFWRAEQAGKVEGIPVLKPDDGNGDDDAYNRGWNACRDFVLAKPTQPAATQQPVAWVAADDPMFRDDWSATTPLLYRREHGVGASTGLVPLYRIAAPVSPSREVEALASGLTEAAGRASDFSWDCEVIPLSVALDAIRALAPVQEKAP